MKTLEDHLRKSKSIIERGDTMIDVIRYLKYQKVEEDAIEKIVQSLESMMAEGVVSPPAEFDEEKKDGVTILFGWFMIAGGIALIIFLWEMGFVATLPVALVIGGIAVLRGRNPDFNV